MEFVVDLHLYHNLSLVQGGGRTTCPPWPLSRSVFWLSTQSLSCKAWGIPTSSPQSQRKLCPVQGPKDYAQDWWDPPSGRMLTTVRSRAKDCLDTALKRFSPALLSVLTGSVFWYLKIPISLGSRVSAASAREDTHVKVCQIPKQKARQHLSTKQKRTSKEMSEGCNNIGNNNRANNSYHSHLKKN